MQIIDFSAPDLSPKYQISNLKSQMIEVITAALVFIVPVLLLFLML